MSVGANVRLQLVVIFAALLAWSGPARAITVNPSHTGENDLYFQPSVSLTAGRRMYDRNIDFGSSKITSAQSGNQILFLIRNDLVIGDNLTVGFNLGLGRLDHGTLTSGSDSLEAMGSPGAGGGLRLSGVLVENTFGADWFTDFQFFSLNSDPKQARITQNDMQLAFGGRSVFGQTVLVGGIHYKKSEFDILGTSDGGRLVEGTGDASSEVGLFVNTRLPVTDTVDLFGEVQFTNQITFNAGASYDFFLSNYTPPVVRKPVVGAKGTPSVEQGESAQAYLEKANTAIRKENFQEALNFLEMALDLDPESPDIFFQIGKSYYLIGEFQLAVQYLNQAIDLKSDVAQYHYFLARTYENLDNTRLATRHYEKALDLKPGHQRSLFRLNQLDGGS
ncbi:MAG: tetratricopeptide repeat protein [bacterium]